MQHDEPDDDETDGEDEDLSKMVTPHLTSKIFKESLLIFTLLSFSFFISGSTKT